MHLVSKNITALHFANVFMNNLSRRLYIWICFEVQEIDFIAGGTLNNNLIMASRLVSLHFQIHLE